MKTNMKFKKAVVGLVAAGALALSANAQAVTIDAGVFAPGAGDAANKITITVPDPGQSGGAGLFTDTINFDLGSFTHFNMTSTVNGIDFFGSTIFENVDDGEIPVGNGYSGAAPSFTNVLLADLGIFRDYHLHPGGVDGGGGSYQLQMWGSTAPVPLPAAAWLFGSGVIGLIGFARRKMNAKA
ncbi:MAG: VPLPA-CTERM sorting domain-containing protein [Nitrospira sp.]|nr:VPLPA-CTERM sorting domain-containing protein [Nitrospira sp.]